MHLCTALLRRLLDLLIERRVGKGTDGDDDEVYALLQHRDGHSADGLHRSRLHDVLRLEGQQCIHIVADRTAGLLCHGLRLGAGAAGHTHQLVVRQKALPVGIRHDAAQKTAAHDAKFCFHSMNLLFLSSLQMQNTKLSIPCSVWKEKQSATFLLRDSVLK